MFEFIKRFFRRKDKMEKDNISLSEVESIIMWHFSSDSYRMMLDGNRYYAGEHDILKRNRTAIGDDGKLITVNNLPNNKIINNQYKKLVKQKVNYIASKTPSISTDNEKYNELLNDLFDKGFLKTIKRIATDVYNNGIGWLFLYVDEEGNLKFKRLNSVEVIPVWTDNDHTELKYAIRKYTNQVYRNGRYEKETHIELYKDSGVEYYILNDNKLNLVEKKAYLTVDDTPYNWQRIPLISFRADELEQPLLNRVKSLQDGLNMLMSDFMNNMQEDSRNTILVIKNYDGENLGEFRRNLATYGAVKVREEGEVSSLQVEVNAGNYDAIVKLLKQTIIENGAGFDSKADTLGNNPNQLNIRSMYSEIDLEANDFETEFQASFEELLWFVANHLKNTGQGDFLGEKVEVVLNRDILVNESQAITDIKNSVGIISEETILAQHPWVIDVQAEQERLKKEREEKINTEDYGGFGEHKHFDDIDE
jgi:phage portal protein, SPP1 gp6-like|nr:MAG TPA: PORTAL PROTEIN [Caudoviricetes sp.]DAF30391.1 MAG TPA: PORTAL PROTEIN [Caudoviricetes sp.]